MKLLYEYMVIFFNLSPTSSHLYPLQVLVDDEDDNGKFRLERVKAVIFFYKNLGGQRVFLN